MSTSALLTIVSDFLVVNGYRAVACLAYCGEVILEVRGFRPAMVGIGNFVASASYTARKMGGTVLGTVHVISSDPAMLEGTGALLLHAGLQVRTYPHGAAFLERYEVFSPECVVSDLHLSGISGLEIQKRLLKKTPTPPIILLASQASARMAVAAMKMGAVDFLLFPWEPVELLDAVHRAMEAGVGPGEASGGGGGASSDLTPREVQVLDLVVEGLASKVIADRLHLSKRTVDVHRSSIMTKLGVHSVAELIRRVIDARLTREPSGGGLGREDVKR